jgi:hypothetical protein
MLELKRGMAKNNNIPDPSKPARLLPTRMNESPLRISSKQTTTHGETNYYETIAVPFPKPTIIATPRMVLFQLLQLRYPCTYYM